MCDFVAYVDDFYNEKSGIYPIIGMTDMMVIKARPETRCKFWNGILW